MELRQAILGLLSIGPASGYDIGRAFAGSVAHFWYADQSQIYRTIDRLAADGAVETERIRQERQPDRKVHSLTAKGRQELMDWLTSPLEPERPKEPFLARIFFAEAVGPDGADRLLAERQEATTQTLKDLQAISTPDSEEGWAEMLRESTRRYGVALAEAELEWIARTREQNDRHRSSS